MRKLSEIAEKAAEQEAFGDGIDDRIEPDEVIELVSALREAMAFACHKPRCRSLIPGIVDTTGDLAFQPCDCGLDALRERVKP